MLITTALTCLALNVYHESRGEPVIGQYAVALVTWNRAGHDSKNVCNVVTKPKQFSWTIQKFKKQHEQYVLERSGFPDVDSNAWKSALKTAKLVLRSKMPDFTRGSTHYHANYIRPIWRTSMRQTVSIGRHIFYR